MKKKQWVFGTVLLLSVLSGCTAKEQLTFITLTGSSPSVASQEVSSEISDRSEISEQPSTERESSSESVTSVSSAEVDHGQILTEKRNEYNTLWLVFAEYRSAWQYQLKELKNGIADLETALQAARAKLLADEEKLREQYLILGGSTSAESLLLEERIEQEQAEVKKLEKEWAELISKKDALEQEYARKEAQYQRESLALGKEIAELSEK